jgi:hypothetical protein
MSGIPDGNIIAAIMTVQATANGPMGPSPIVMSSIEDIRAIVTVHATAATMRNASDISAGAEISCGPSPV